LKQGVETMRKNRILGVAIAAALSLQVGVAQAAGSFKNVNQTFAGALDAAAADGKVLTGNIPAASFDSISAGAKLVDVLSDTAGIVYATELFGGEGSPTLPKTNMAAVLYTVDGKIDKNFNMKFTLSAGTFAEDPKLAISDTGDDGYTSLIGKTSGGNGLNTVNFFVSAQTNNLQDGDQLMLAYKITEANDLATGGTEIKLNAELKTPSDLPVNPPREVTIASSKQAVKAELSSEDTGTVKISVSDDSKKFTGSGNPFVNVATTGAQIGYLKITNLNGTGSEIKESDGTTPFKVGEGTDGALNDTGDGSTLVITPGQFAASKTAPGEVILNVTTKVVANPVEDETATFKLTDADFPALSSGNNIPIQIIADGSTPINTVGDQPEATLKLDFKAAYVGDIEVGPVKLRQIGKDGTVCVVYVVPASSVAIEKINIRITNDSQEAGTLQGNLYNTDTGELLGSGFLNGTDDLLGAGKTIVYQATDLEEKIATWEGRAMLEIVSTLPSLQVLALMRNQRDRSLVTNVSQGATGNSCSR
jgi:hypothetical protein